MGQKLSQIRVVEKLDQDVLSIVFSFLPFSDLLIALRCCRSWQKVAWKQRCRSLSATVLTNSALLLIVKSRFLAKHMVNIRVRVCDGQPAAFNLFPPNLHTLAFRSVFFHFGTLPVAIHTLKLVMDWSYRGQFSSLPNLTNLDLQIGGFENADRELLDLKKCTALRSLQIYEVKATSLSDLFGHFYPPHLLQQLTILKLRSGNEHEISVERVPNIDDILDGLPSLCECKSLLFPLGWLLPKDGSHLKYTSLIIEWTTESSINEAAPWFGSQPFPHVKALHFNWFLPFHDDLCIRFLSAFSQLRCLDLESSLPTLGFITNASCPSLEVLLYHFRPECGVTLINWQLDRTFLSIHGAPKLCRIQIRYGDFAARNVWQPWFCKTMTLQLREHFFSSARFPCMELFRQGEWELHRGSNTFEKMAEKSTKKKPIDLDQPDLRLSEESNFDDPLSFR